MPKRKGTARTEQAASARRRVHSMLQKLLSGDGGSGPPSPGISLIACDLQRSLNILTLPLDVAADDADDADDADAHTPLCD